jgi:TolA-binding protein
MADLETAESRIENSGGIPKEADIKDAISKFQDFASIFPEDPAAPDYLLRASDLTLLLDLPQKSVKLLNQIIDNYPAYNKMEDVKYNRASHLDFELRDTTKAKEAYQEFMVDYPNSPLVNDCKSRIENIQYSIEELTEKFMKDLEENGSMNELP